jgi:hypothetical protein
LDLMLRRHLGYELALVAVICTLAIFLFPSASGPYPIVHGPVTALRAMRARVLLLISLAVTLLGLANVALWALGAEFGTASDRVSTLHQSSILRC